MDHMDELTTFLHPEIDDAIIYITLPERWPEGLNAPKIIVRLRKALYDLRQAPRLWHDYINSFLLSHQYIQSSADLNLYLRRDTILIPVHDDDISVSYLEDVANAAIEVKVKLREQYTITNLSPAWHFIGIEIYRVEIST